MTERERIIDGMSESELAIYVAIGGTIPKAATNAFKTAHCRAGELVKNVIHERFGQLETFNACRRSIPARRLWENTK